jgi:hypothetical protein
MHSGGGRPTRRTLATAWIIVRALETMSSTSTGWRSRQADTSGRLTSTSRSPRRIFCSTVQGAPASAATSATHCSLSESGPISSGTVDLRRDPAGDQRARDCTTRVGMR